MQSIKTIIVNLLLILLGLYILYFVYWSHDPRKYFGILAFLLIGYGFVSYSIALTRLIIPTKLNFSFAELSDTKKYQIFKDKVGTKKFKFTILTFVSLFIIFISVFAYFFVAILNKYEMYQLTTYGHTQKVEIKDIELIGKGGPYAVFDFYLNKKAFTNHLDPKNFSIGDSATIIFSTENPDINMWAEDYYFEKNKLKTK